MQACILCPGPSLANVSDLPTCSVSIAVNRAALRFGCDYWAALDYQTFTRDEPNIKGNPLLFTRAEYRHKTHRDGIDAEDLFGLLSRDRINWPMYTLPAAMVLAAWLGAKRIDIYGCDWALNQPDFDGSTPQHSRRDMSRWAAETVLFSRVVDWLNEHGTEVKRHGTTRRS